MTEILQVFQRILPLLFLRYSIFIRPVGERTQFYRTTELSLTVNTDGVNHLLQFVVGGVDSMFVEHRAQIMFVHDAIGGEALEVADEAAVLSGGQAEQRLQ